MLKYLFPTFLLIALLFSCKSDYAKMRDRELASGERHDSLFLGLFLGMTRDSFYKHCTGLNQQKLISDGGPGGMAQHPVTTFKAPATLNFFPQFTPDGKIWQMPANFSYVSWSPWNPGFSNDSLMAEVLPLAEQWFGEGFLSVKGPNNSQAWARVDGNRRVLIFSREERFVQMEITDLLVEEEMKKQAKGESKSSK